MLGLIEYVKSITLSLTSLTGNRHNPTRLAKIDLAIDCDEYNETIVAVHCIANGNSKRQRQRHTHTILRIEIGELGAKLINQTKSTIKT